MYDMIPQEIRAIAEPFDKKEISSAKKGHLILEKVKHMKRAFFAMNPSLKGTVDDAIHHSQWMDLFLALLVPIDQPVFGQTMNPSNENRLLVLRLLAKFALTDPDSFQTFNHTDALLHYNEVTACWRGAILAVGSQYEEVITSPTQERTPPKSSTPTQVTPDSSSNPTSKDNPPSPQARPQAQLPPQPPIAPLPITNTASLPSILNSRPRQQQLRAAFADDKRRFVLRFDLNLKVNIDQSGVSATIRAVREWFGALLTEDPSALILPWEKESRSPPLRSISDIPDSIPGLGVYFKRILAPTVRTRFITYTNCRLGLSVSPDNLLKRQGSNLDFFYENSGTQLYLKPLKESENPENAGWLAYTGNFTSAEELELLIVDGFKKIGIPQKEIGVKIMPLPGNKPDDLRHAHRSSGGNWHNQSWVAAQIFCDKREVGSVKSALNLLFNRDNLPHIQYRFIPSENLTFVSPEGKLKFASMFAKHRQIISILRNAACDHIIQLDTPDSNGLSLRDHMYSLRSNITQRRLFHSVHRQPAWMDNSSLSITAMCYPEHLAEAKAVLTILPAYIQRLTNDDVSQWFTQDIMDISSEAVFDEKRNTFVTSEELILDALLNEDVGGRPVEFDLQQMEKIPMATSKTTDDMTRYSFGTELGFASTPPLFQILLLLCRISSLVTPQIYIKLTPRALIVENDHQIIYSLLIPQRSHQWMVVILILACRHMHLPVKTK